MLNNRKEIQTAVFSASRRDELEGVPEGDNDGSWLIFFSDQRRLIAGRFARVHAGRPVHEVFRRFDQTAAFASAICSVRRGNRVFASITGLRGQRLPNGQEVQHEAFDGAFPL